LRQSAKISPILIDRSKPELSIYELLQLSANIFERLDQNAFLQHNLAQAAGSPKIPIK
jgi:hypothetical protein